MKRSDRIILLLLAALAVDVGICIWRDHGTQQNGYRDVDLKVLGNVEGDAAQPNQFPESIRALDGRRICLTGELVTSFDGRSAFDLVHSIQRTSGVGNLPRPEHFVAVHVTQERAKECQFHNGLVRIYGTFRLVATERDQPDRRPYQLDFDRMADGDGKPFPGASWVAPKPVGFEPFALVVTCLGLAVALSIRGYRQWRHSHRVRLRLLNICAHCGYDLRATPNRCPECGHIARLE